MDVDGSPIRIAGKAKPFVATPESIIDLKLDHLALSPYLGYVPLKLPIKMPSGALSADLQVHFVKTEPEPAIAVAGTVTVDQLAIHDSADAPLVGFNQLVVPLNDIEPLVNVFRVGAIKLDGLTISAVLNPDGTTNFTALSAVQTPPKGASAAPSQTASAPLAGTSIPMAAAQAPAVKASVATPIASATPAATATQMAASPQATGAAQVMASATASAAAGKAPSATASMTPSPAIGTPSAGPTTAAALPQSFGAAAPAASASPEASPAAPPEHPLDFTLDSFALSNGTVNVNDRNLPAPIQVALQAIQLGVNNFAIGPRAAPATYNFAANLSTGGTIATKGAFDLTKSQSSSDVTLSQIDLPSLQGFAQAALAGSITSGKLNAHAAVQESFAPGHVNVHVEPATVALDNFAVQYANSRDQPIKWKDISVDIAQIDLEQHTALVNEVRSQGVQLDVRHLRDGSFSLEALLKHPPSTVQATKRPAPRAASRDERRQRPESHRTASGPARQPAPPAASSIPRSPKWTYSVKAVALEQTGINFEDDTAPKPVKVALAPLNLHLKDISDDFTKPITLDVDGTVNRRGGFKVAGTAVIEPLKANLRVNTQRLDLTLANAYLANQLNTTIASAVLTMNAQVNAAIVRDKLQLGYRGELTVGSVRMLDKVTGEDFARWTSFALNGIDVQIGKGEPQVRIGAVALSNFYARIILNRDGKLNLKDITANPNAAPTSLTQQHSTTIAAAPTPTPAAAATTRGSNARPDANPGDCYDRSDDVERGADQLGG